MKMILGTEGLSAAFDDAQTAQANTRSRSGARSRRRGFMIGVAQNREASSGMSDSGCLERLVAASTSEWNHTFGECVHSLALAVTIWSCRRGVGVLSKMRQ